MDQLFRVYFEVVSMINLGTKILMKSKQLMLGSKSELEMLQPFLMPVEDGILNYWSWNCSYRCMKQGLLMGIG
jgi:hypothetical protein